MRAFGAIAVIVASLVFMPFNGLGEHLFRFLDLGSDLGQVREFHWGAVFSDQASQVQSVKIQIAVLGLKSFLWIVERLLDQVCVSVVRFQCQLFSIVMNKYNFLGDLGHKKIRML
jgi:hypothetical protein